MTNADGHNFFSYSKYTFVYKPEEYANLDPVFIYNDKISNEERIRRMIEKTPLDELPKDLIPKYKLGIQPPKFHFGIPATLESFYNLAVMHNYAVHYPGMEHDPGTFMIPESMKVLREMIYKKFSLNCSPGMRVVRSAQNPPTSIFLAFLSSYQGAVEFSCDPKELGERVTEYLNLDQPLMWYLDRNTCDWHAGRLTFRMVSADEDG